jgi:hypothetical protein
MRSTAVAAILGLVLVAACGDDGNGNGVPDAGPGSPDGSTGDPDAATGTPDAPVGTPDGDPGDDGGLTDAQVGDGGATGDAFAADALLPSDAFDPDALGPDALVPPDALVGDGGAAFACNPTGDYVEMNDATNDAFDGGTVEATGLTIAAGGDPFTIGGCTDPANVTTDYTDGDDFAFEITGTDPVWLTIDLTSPQGALADGLIAVVYDATDPQAPVDIAGAQLSDGSAIVVPVALAPGDYWIDVYYPDLTLAGDLTYQLTVSVLSCESPSAGDYTEANDGASSRGNDMVAVTFSPLTTVQTAVNTDAPEPSGVSGSSGDVRGLVGNTAMVTSAGDAFLDRDTFLISTGPDVDRLVLLLGWDDQNGAVTADMDLLVFPAGTGATEDIVGGGLNGSTVAEFGGAVVEPSSDYWVWAGTYATGATLPAGGTTYALTVCYH